MGGVTTMMDVLAQYITRKRIFIGFGSLIIFILFIAALSGGIVIIRAPEKSGVNGYLKNSADDSEDSESIKPVEIKAGGWSMYYQSSGDYYFDLNNGENQTVYQRHVGMFSITNIDAKFEKQKQTTNLGYGNFDCAINDTVSAEVVYYFCDKLLDNESYYSQTHDGVNYINNSSGLGIKAYNGTLIQVDSDTGGDSISLSKLSFNTSGVEKQNFTYKPSRSFTPDSYGENTLIIDSTFSENSRLALYDSKSNNIEVYKDSISKPYVINVSKYINSKNGFSNNFQLVDDTLYIFSGIKTSDNLGEQEKSEKNIPNQKIVAINIDSKKLISQFDIPKNVTINNFAVGLDKKIALSITDTETSKEGLYVYEKGEFSKIDVAGRLSDELCWTKDNLVYLAKDSGDIYQYNQTDRSSSLLYANPSDTVAGLNCNFGKIYFPSLPKDSQSSKSDYRWFELSNESIPKDYTRPESVFPIIDDRLSGISWSYIFKNIIYVTLDKSSGCSVTQDEKDQALKYLDLLHIDSSVFTVSFSKDC